jgi:hypothetical protein
MTPRNAPQATFSNIEDKVIEFIASAQASLHIAVCWFTHPCIFEALKKRVAAGVEVSLLLNYDEVNFRPQGLDFFALERAGTKVFAYPGPDLLHHKFAVADKRQLLSGSFNWTRASHCDFMLWQESPSLCLDFLHAFQEALHRARPIFALRDVPPRALLFHHLHQPVWCSPDDIRRRILAGGRVWLVGITEAEWQLRQREQSLAPIPLRLWESFWSNCHVWDEVEFRSWLAGQQAPRGSRALSAYCLRLRVGDVLVAVSPQQQVLGTGIVGSEIEFKASSAGGARRYVAWLALPQPALLPGVAVKQSTLKRYAASGLQLTEEIRKMLQGQNSEGATQTYTTL